MSIKGTIHFAFGPYGFSESYHAEPASKDVAAMITALRAVQSDRCFCLGDGWRIIQYNATDTDAPGTGERQLVNLEMNYPSSLSDNPNNCMQCYWLGTRYRANFSFRGLPDKWLEWDEAHGEHRPTDDAISGFQKWREAVKGQKLGFMHVDLEGANATGYPIQTWEEDGDRIKIGVAGMAATAKVGVKLLFREVTGITADEKARLNGRTHIISKVSGSVYQIDIPVGLFPNFEDISGGRVYPRIKKVVTIDDGDVIGGGTRKIGKALSTWKGRITNRLI